jgi:branched-chain amino acid transport system permease protein
MNDWYLAHTILLQQTAVFAVLAVSIQVVMRSGIFSLASVALFGVAGYVGGNLAIDGLPAIAVLPILFAGGAVLGYLLSLMLVRLRGLYLAMATIALDGVVVVAAVNGGSYTNGAIGLYGVPPIITTPALLLIAAVVMVCLSQFERKNLGRSMEALRLDENLTRSLGIDLKHERSFLFSLSAGLGALAGGMNILAFTTIQPVSFGFNLITIGITMAVLGGVRSWRGAVMGAVFVIWFPQFVHGLNEWKGAIYGLLLVFVGTLYPTGALGFFTAVFDRFKRSTGRRNQKPSPEAVLESTKTRVSSTDAGRVL